MEISEEPVRALVDVVGVCGLRAHVAAVQTLLQNRHKYDRNYRKDLTFTK